MQFLQLIETIASNLTSSNISEFITLTENLISLGESVFQHQSTTESSKTAASTTPTSTSSN